jgi:penicillin-binding protein 1C
MIPPRWRRVVVGACGAAALLALATRLSMRDFPPNLESLDGTAVKPQVLARDGTPLSYTLTNDWNTTDLVPLSQVPSLLKTAFIVAEDQHFYDHHGVDWPARFAALWLDVRHGSSAAPQSLVALGRGL